MPRKLKLTWKPKKYIEVEDKLGEPLGVFIGVCRQGERPDPWYRIANKIEAATGVTVTGDTVHSWYEGWSHWEAGLCAGCVARRASS